MPLTAEGKKVLADMKEEYGDKKGAEVFYSSINKGVEGSDKWHKKPGNTVLSGKSVKHAGE